jgi:hypothetical protein
MHMGFGWLWDGWKLFLAHGVNTSVFILTLTLSKNKLEM